MKKPKKSDVKYYGYGVEVISRCTDSYRSPEQYGEWRESWDNHLKGIARAGVEHPDVVSIHDIARGEDAWVVWVEYSSGDSFGCADRGYTDVIGIFRKADYAAAEELQRGLEVTSKYDYNRHDYKIETSDGQVFESGFASWTGYFDSLDTVHIERVTVV